MHPYQYVYLSSQYSTILTKIIIKMLTYTTFISLVQQHLRCPLLKTLQIMLLGFIFVRKYYISIIVEIFSWILIGLLDI